MPGLPWRRFLLFSKRLTCRGGVVFIVCLTLCMLGAGAWPGYEGAHAWHRLPAAVGVSFVPLEGGGKCGVVYVVEIIVCWASRRPE